MIANLHGLSISLRCEEPQVQKQWRDLFDFETLEAAGNKVRPAANITVQVDVTADPPAPPPIQPFYISQFPPIEVYAYPQDGVTLRPSSHVLIQLNLPPGNRPQADIAVLLTPHILDSDGFEDVLTLGLAPFLRRKGMFMVHAFSAAWQDQAVMFVGPSGSGKTSSGLALISAGWYLLANDIALLNEQSLINALLSPGTVHATPDTLKLIPELSEQFGDHEPHPMHGKVAIPRLDLLQMPDPLLSAPLTTIYFPQIVGREEHETANLFPAVGLARMMEASIDQWDKPTWFHHVDFLDRLSHQVHFRSLSLGQDLATLPALIEKEIGR